MPPSHTITLSGLITNTRSLADIIGSDFITDSEITTFINNSISELYDLIQDQEVDYFTITGSFTIASPSGQATLPDNFYKLKALDKLNGSTYNMVTPFNIYERNKTTSNFPYFTSEDNNADVNYKVVGTNIYIVPPEQSPGTYRLWYIPTAPILVSGTDTIQFQAAWNEYISVGAAIQCKIKEESSTYELELRRSQLEKRIEKVASDRDTGGLIRIQNIRNKWRYL